LESLQLGWIPMHAFTDDVDSYDWSRLATHEFNGMPTAFSGPFVLKEWVRGDHWTQVRNARYWRGAPHLEGVVTRVLSGQAELVELLKKGEVDVGVDIRPQYLAELEEQSNLQVYKFWSDSYDFIGFQLGDPNDPQPRLNPDGTVNAKHGEHPILKDKRVRQAIVYALDRNEIVAQARLGQGVLLPANVLPTVGWAYNTDLQPRRTDLEKARDLLNQAGWVLNQATGIRSKEGVPLKLRLHTNAGNSIREAMATLIQAQLRKVGIQVEVVSVEYTALLEVLLGQTFDMVLISWSHLGVNPDDMRFWSAESDVPGKGSNFVSYYGPEVEAWLAEASVVPGCDQDRRAALYRQTQVRLYEDQPYCWLDMPRNLVVVGKRVGGINPGPWNMWHDIGDWYIATP
jgi:peptide/nickel transport system substrate-binding protein